LSKKLYKVILCLLVLAAIFVPITAFESSQTIKPVGDEQCLSCHQKQKSYLSTAHHRTSTQATKDSIAGKFEEGKNILKTREPEVYYRMEVKKDGFFQTAMFGNALTISRRFDLVIGSGRKGQTYLYWDWTVPLDKTDRLYQLPVSFWTELDAWVHSPGYDDRVVNFSRPVFPRCLECHASFFETVKDPTIGNLGTITNSYNKSNYVLGISCEKCHGPGQQHIDLQNDKTRKPLDQLIVNTAKLSRERQIDLCALCHGGLGVAKAPAFSYTAGDDLEKYVHLAKPGPNEPVDVHGNQVALMEKSRCYQTSSMTCSTCHDVHLPQRDPAAFVGRCLTCHKVQSCGLFRKSGDRIAGKCVDCHMPLQNSNLIVSSHEDKKLREQVRTHWIKVYPEIKIP
jgi:hypothetical protein